jgi:hypothetical protein
MLWSYALPRRDNVCCPLSGDGDFSCFVYVSNSFCVVYDLAGRNFLTFVLVYDFICVTQSCVPLFY